MDKFTVVDPLVKMKLRGLRLWHWQRAMKYRELQGSLERFNSRSLRDCIKRYDESASVHLSAVQTLNEFFDIDDTAEQDEIKNEQATLQHNGN